MAAFTLPALSPAEPRNQHREMLQRLGAARNRLWIAELSQYTAERNRCAIGGTMNVPVEDAAITRFFIIAVGCFAQRLLNLINRKAKHFDGQQASWPQSVWLHTGHLPLERAVSAAGRKMNIRISLNFGAGALALPVLECFIFL